MLSKNTFIIAEAGVNHNGSIETAKRLIDKAVEAKADAVKFQTFKATSIIAPIAKKAEYQLKETSQDESQLEMAKRLELSEEAHIQLIEYCKLNGILFLSTTTLLFSLVLD